MDANAHGAVSSDKANMHNAEIFVKLPVISVKLPKNNVRLPCVAVNSLALTKYT